MAQSVMRNSQSNNCQRAPRGFTLVEFIVASTISVIVVIGVYEVFRQVMRMEHRYGVTSRYRGAANAVADHMVATIERVVNLPDSAAIIAEQDNDSGVYSLVCRTSGVGYEARSTRDVALQLRRYRWGFDGEDERTGTIQLQIMDYAGSANISSSISPGELDADQQWAKVQPDLVATGLDSVSVRFKSLSDPNATWVESWQGNGGDVVVRVNVGVGGQTAERLVVPHVTGTALEDG